MNKNYYEELIEKIEKLIENKDLNQASQLILEELKMPYIPKIYEDKLIYFANTLGLNDDKKSKNSYFSREEILTILNEYQKHDIEFLIDIASGFEQFNWIGYEKEIEKIFNIANIDNKIKSIIYNNLVIQKFDYDFKIDNLVINPLKNKTIFETEFCLKNIENFSKANSQDPSLTNICERIFFIYIMNSFPNSLFFKYRDISNEFVMIAKVMVGEKAKNDLNNEENDIFNVINGI